MDRAQVAALLAGHTAQDDVEHAALARFRAAFDQSPAPFSKHSFAPGHLTCSAVVAAPDLGALLLIHHPALGLWIQPGGHVAPTDASPLAAARRELAEETALVDAPLLLDGLLDVDVHQVPAGTKGQPAHLHLDLRFAFRAPTRAVRAGSDAKAVRWVAWDALATVDTDDSVRRAAARLAARIGAIP